MQTARIAAAMIVGGTLAIAANQPAEARSKAAAYLIDRIIAEECPAGGTFSPTEIVERDLTGDGAADLILDLHGVRCADGGMSGGCGPAACNANVYVRTSGLLKLVTEEFSVGFEIGPGDPPSIEFKDRKFQSYRLRWNGKSFE